MFTRYFTVNIGNTMLTLERVLFIEIKLKKYDTVSVRDVSYMRQLCVQFALGYERNFLPAFFPLARLLYPFIVARSKYASKIRINVPGAARGHMFTQLVNRTIN